MRGLGEGKERSEAHREVFKVKGSQEHRDYIVCVGGGEFSARRRQ